MQQGELSKAHPVIFDSDKKQRFGISNNGEFIDNVYREQEPSKLVGRIIGRNQVQMHAKKVYTTADIVCETYLHKKGSWMQNWKRRYFVLRKDIRSICYYDNRENLTLLGSIPLDSETKIQHILPKDANGFEHVIAMQAEGEDGGAKTNTYIRFDNAETLKSWVLDIKNEALNLRIGEEEQQNWWSATFDKIDAVEIKSNAVRRENLDNGSSKGSSKPNPNAANRRSSSTLPSPSVNPGTPAESPHNPHAAEEAVINSMMRDMKLNAAGKASGDRKRTASTDAPDDDSDIDSDNEDATPRDNPSSKALPLPPGASPNKPATPTGPPGAPGAPPARRTQVATSFTAGADKKRKFKLLKAEKPAGPPPFDSPTAKKFEGQEGTLRGLQVSLKLCNVCAYQDRIFVVLFGNMPAAPAGSPAAPVAPTGTVTGAHDIQTVFGSTGSKWTQISRTELRTVDEKPVYGENYVSDFRIHFSIVQDMIPESCKEIRFVVYRQENEMNYKEPSKASNLNMQLEMAKCIIPKKMFDSNPILKVAMQVKMEIPMDIAVPLFKEAQVVLGVARMQSKALYRERAEISKTLKIEPYSEILYTFATTTGKTMSLEQLYASKYSVSVAQALLNMWQLERNEYIFEIIDSLRKELNQLADCDEKLSTAPKRSSYNDSATATAIANMAAAQAAHAAHSHPHNEEKHVNRIEHLLSAVNTIEEYQQESLETTALVLENCNKMEEGKNLVSNVIDGKVGGGYLRRSTWKKYTAWQYCATNLNVHLMLTKHYTFAECMADGGAGSVDTDENVHGGGLYCVPTITMGVPAAHELKFSDGGLRKLFHDITDNDQKLRWINAIQAPTMDLLKLMLMKSPKEAHSLFGAKCNITNNEDIAHVLKRKMEISRRLDICASQALGSAVASVRTICMLAAQLGGKFMDILSRSLRIGFMVMFQSMLSTQGAELGMIEDLDIAALWLSLVTVRLLVKEDESSGGEDEPTDRDDFDKASSFVGKGDGVMCRRDKGGRLIVDIEISAEEGIAVLEAHRNMSGFPYFSTTPRDYPGSPIMFNHNPTVKPSPVDAQYAVYATAELFGVAFSQGVNEMQTLANLSSSRDVLRQVEINNAALARLEGFYANYKEALMHQLDQKKPDLLEVLNPTGISSSASSGSLASASGPKTPPNRRQPSGSFMGGATASVDSTSSTTVNTGRPPSASMVANPGGKLTSAPSFNLGGMRRRKSLRESIGGGDNAMMATVNTLAAKVVSSNDRMLDQLKDAVAQCATNPHDKHVDVLLRSSALCREIGAITNILCKSGKDRTSMGVTLENTRSLVEDVGVLNGQEVCQLMRFQGVRRMNVYANTGQAMFAFNHLQRIALPTCYRPPTGCHSGNVNS